MLYTQLFRNNLGNLWWQMVIERDIYYSIINSASPTPPESGGILGGKDGIIIESLEDNGMPSCRMCSYYPNVRLLNQAIKGWQSREIDFMGIYHIHYWSVSTLSEGDKLYISKIMDNMPKEIEKLYFPILVMPEKEIACYVARRISGKLVIEKDSIVLM